MIYIIFGASGTGKSTMLNCVFEMYGENSIHKKATTRRKRQYDDREIESHPEGIPVNRFAPPNGYIYSNYGYEYGIEKRQIDNALAKKIPHFIICNDIETIKRIKHDYYDVVRIIYFQFDAPRQSILEIQRRRNITDDEIELRMSKIDYYKNLFASNIELFDTTVLNRYGSNPEIALRKDVKRIVDTYENELQRNVPSKEVLFEMVDYLKELIRDMETRKPIEKEYPVDKGFVFIIMPMTKNCGKARRDLLWTTYQTIRATASKMGFRAERVDEIQSNMTIDSKIYDNIKKAEVVIADLSFERPNCYYELGYARALGKDIITIAHIGSKIHFDAEHFDCLFFSEGEELSIELEKRLLSRRLD